MIYQEITESMFRDAFHNHGRADAWSYKGLGALYAYLVERSGERSSGDGYDRLDVIAIDCEFCEYGCIDEFHASYDSEDYPDMDAIKDHTTVIEVPNSSAFIVGEF
tara:strand:+ start:356 stop:673 length:318 start_codon:yes stop_codon:yes gene_type:complete